MTYPGRPGYPRNQWYVAAFSSEVGNGSLLHRRLLDVPVVLCRTLAGAAVALYDRCSGVMCGRIISALIDSEGSRKQSDRGVPAGVAADVTVGA
jgi:hypothetical protein